MNCPQEFTTPYDILREDCEKCINKECLIPEVKPYNADLGEWYNYLIDDCKHAILRFRKERDELLVQTYHYIGKSVVDSQDHIERCNYGEHIIETLASDLGLKSRNVRYMVALARVFPKYEDIPNNDNISWSGAIRLITQGTPEEKQNHVCNDYETVKRCKECHKIKKDAL